MRYATKWPEYARQWDRMTIKPERVASFERDALFAIEHKDRYLAIEATSGVKWYHIAMLHRRESDADFSTYLGNGQRLSHRTTIEPTGRGPFIGPDAFRLGALDALHVDALDMVLDWRLEKILYYCEVFNGGGYSRRGLPSPYIWGGSNIQQRGKFVADHVFDASVIDPQPGCAPLLWMMAQHDPTIQFVRETADGPPLVS